MMLSSPLMTTQDKKQRLWGQLRAGQSGLALSTAQTIGVNLSLAQLNQIQAAPQNYLWSAPKNNDADYAYLIYATGRLADTDLNGAALRFDVMPKARHRRSEISLSHCRLYWRHHGDEK